MPDKIVVRGARVHNLKNLDLEIPRGQLVVITGVSGSGKSSLAFDTLYAEGQRRYIESLSADTRQFLRQLEKPDVDSIEGLSPAIAVQPRAAGFGPRSTVGTVTEIADFLRLFFARLGRPSCPRCGKEISAQTIQEIVDQLRRLPPGTKLVIGAPIAAPQAVDYRKVLRELVRAGFTRVKVDGEIRDISETVPVDHSRPLILLVDRLTLREGIETRLADSLETASRVGQQVIQIEVSSDNVAAPVRELTFSQKLACTQCGISFPELTPALFSFNRPQGACPACGGLGYLANGSLGRSGRQADEESVQVCPDCRGARLNPQSLAVRVAGKNIAEISSWPAAEAMEFFHGLQLSGQDALIGEPLIKEIVQRLGFLTRLGLDYLSIDRPASSLSGGEAQRARLATQIGASLAGVLYIFDEPSIGLHQKDNAELLSMLRQLRDAGNSVILVEHDPEAILSADTIVDMGPGAGVNGGAVVALGTPAELMVNERSLTGQFLSGKRKIPLPSRRRPGTGNFLVLKKASRNNLKAVTVEIPIGAMTCVTGVSGSGKSTLVMEVLYQALVRRRRRRKADSILEDLEGWEHFDRVIAIDQAPISRTPRSSPATYIGIYDQIRELFAQLPEARVRGYGASRFSFNIAGGRCEACCGDGLINVDMHFLPDLFVPCDVCHARRYNRETLEIKFKGMSIADVLDLTVSQAVEVLSSIAPVSQKLQMLAAVGLGYVKLGQPAYTLSGGEAQRVKLAKELGRKSAGRSLYILDEPTSGLHFADVEKLLEVLHSLTDRGNTIIIIEHNLDVIKTADYVIDLGPGSGIHGGSVVAHGTPEEIAQTEHSFTGRYLARLLAHSE